MKIFISWSGERSKKAAIFLKTWLSQVIQMAEPWISTEIEKGKRWNSEISEKLTSTQYGIICLTQQNLNSNWIHFEAGALSKTLDSNLTCLLIGTSPSQLEFPLAQFQHTSIEKEDVFRMLRSINNQLIKANSKKLNDDTLKGIFDVFYPQFKSKMKDISNGYYDDEENIVHRSEKAILEEILENVRGSKIFSKSYMSDIEYVSKRDWEKIHKDTYEVVENYEMGLITNTEKKQQIFDIFIKSELKNTPDNT